MRRGDALLLYTDGMVETPHRDIMLGVDKMLGQAERLLRGEFDGGAKRIIEAIGSPQRRPGAAAGAPTLRPAVVGDQGRCGTMTPRKLVHPPACRPAPTSALRM